MLFFFTSELILFLLFSKCVYSDDRNETSSVKDDADFADTGVAFSGNITANFSVTSVDLEEKKLNLSTGPLEKNFSITDRNENQVAVTPTQKLTNEVEFNTQKRNSTWSVQFDDFRPSPQLETYYEFNKFPVKPVLPEAKVARHFENSSSRDQETIVKGEVFSIENERNRNLDHFEPGFSAFGSGHLPNSPKGLVTDTGDIHGNNSPWRIRQSIKGENNKNEHDSDTPWVSKVRFPSSPGTIESPYHFVSTFGSGGISPCCPENVGQAPTPPTTPNAYIKNNRVSLKSSEYLPPRIENIGPSPSTSGLDASRDSFYNNNINSYRGIYSPPSAPSVSSTGVGSTENKNINRFPSFSSIVPPSEDYNFNNLVEVPKTYSSGLLKKHEPHQKTFETYNIMEQPASESEYKTYGGGLYYSPWKKILKLFATFIPIGLLISALTPTVITVTNVNDTNVDPNMSGSRYRSNDDSKKQLTDHLLASLDYFDKLNENGCEYRVFCELLVSASHMQNSKQHVENLLDNFAKQEINYKSRAEELKRVFEAVRMHSCHSIPCEYIKNPT